MADPVPQKKDDGTVAKKIAGKRKSIEAASKAHAAANEARLNEIKNIQANFAMIKDNPAFLDIVKTAQRFIDLNHKLAQDGVGARETGHKLVDGTTEIENYFFTKDERIAYVDKAAGIQQVLDYIDRQLNPPKPNVNTPPVAEAPQKPVKTV